MGFRRFLKFRVPEQKRDFFRQDLEGRYLHIWNGIKKKTFDSFFSLQFSANKHS